MKVSIERLYRLLIRAASSLQSPFLLAVRLYWGWQMAQTGWGKLGNLDHVTGFGALHRGAGIRRGNLAGSRAGIESHRAVAGGRYAGGLHHG
jgi:uncharacterized membrane protein YphA (DoxX/SURF4 family)